MKKRDIAFLICMGIFVLSSFLVYWKPFHYKSKKMVTKPNVVVTFDGEEIWTGSLSENQKIQFDKGGGHNTLIIQSRQVWMEDADCKGKDCIRQGKIKKTGQSIVCLPHKIVITIEGEADIDSIVK